MRLRLIFLCGVYSPSTALLLCSIFSIYDALQLGINCSVNAGAVIGSRVAAAPGSYLEGRINDDVRIGR